MPGIARSISTFGLSFCTLIAVAAAINSATAASPTNVSTLLEHVETCIAEIRVDATTNSACGMLSEAALRDRLDPSLQKRIGLDDASSEISEHRLSGLAKHLRSIVSTNSAGASLDTAKLDDIMADYSFEQSDETISLATRFWQWVADKLRKTGLQDRLDAFGESFSISAEKRALIRKIVTWGMGGALIVALLFFFWTLWRYLDPTLRKRRMDFDGTGTGTGADRGNTPVMSLSQIHQLPTNQQPSALLVACLDRLKGQELPEDVWKFTNSEIATTLKRKQSDSITPMQKLIAIAELTIYGGRQASPSEVEGCFEAADKILEPGLTAP